MCRAGGSEVSLRSLQRWSRHLSMIIQSNRNARAFTSVESPPHAQIEGNICTYIRCCAADACREPKPAARFTRTPTWDVSPRGAIQSFPSNMFGCKPIICQDRLGTTMLRSESNRFVLHSAAPRWEQGGGAGGRGALHENLCSAIRCRLGTHAEDLVV